jgi:hypothetical protein
MIKVVDNRVSIYDEYNILVAEMRFNNSTVVGFLNQLVHQVETDKAVARLRDYDAGFIRGKQKLKEQIVSRTAAYVEGIKTL